MYATGKRRGSNGGSSSVGPPTSTSSVGASDPNAPDAPDAAAAAAAARLHDDASTSASSSTPSIPMPTPQPPQPSHPRYGISLTQDHIEWEDGDEEVDLRRLIFRSPMPLPMKPGSGRRSSRSGLTTSTSRSGAAASRSSRPGTLGLGGGSRGGTAAATAAGNGTSSNGGRTPKVLSGRRSGAGGGGGGVLAGGVGAAAARRTPGRSAGPTTGSSSARKASAAAAAATTAAAAGLGATPIAQGRSAASATPRSVPSSSRKKSPPSSSSKLKSRRKRRGDNAFVAAAAAAAAAADGDSAASTGEGTGNGSGPSTNGSADAMDLVQTAEEDLPTQEKSNVSVKGCVRDGGDDHCASNKGVGHQSRTSRTQPAGSRRRLRRMNTHDGIASSSRSAMSVASECIGVRSNFVADTSAAAISGPVTAASALHQPTIFRDIDIEEIAGTTPSSGIRNHPAAASSRRPSTADATSGMRGVVGRDRFDCDSAAASKKKRRRPTAIGEGSAWLYGGGKENNKSECAESDVDHDGKTKKKRIVPQQQQLQAQLADVETAKPVSEDIVENSGVKGNDPFNDLLQELDDRKSPISASGKKLQRRNRTSAFKRNRVASVASTLPARPSSAPSQLSSGRPLSTSSSGMNLSSREEQCELRGNLSQGSVAKYQANAEQQNKLKGKLSQGGSVPISQPRQQPQLLVSVPVGSNSKTIAMPQNVASSAVGAIQNRPLHPPRAQVASALMPFSESTVPPTTDAPPVIGKAEPMAVPSTEGGRVDDLLGGIDFNDDFFPAMDNLEKAKQESRAGAEANVCNRATTDTSAQNGPMPLSEKPEIPSNDDPNVCNAKASDTFGDFPEIDYAALDNAIGQRNLDAGPKEVPPKQQQQHIHIVPPAGNEFDLKDDFAFPELDFDAMDKLVEQKLSRRNREGDDPFALPPPPPQKPVRNQKVAATSSNAYNNALPGPAFLSFSRYKVISVNEDLATYTRTLRVAQWVSGKENCEEGNMISVPTPKLLSSDKVDGCVHLRGEWYHTECEPGDIIHLCSLSGNYGTEKSALPIILDSNPPQGSDLEDDLVIIVHPDTLLTPTAISETVTCIRRAVLKMRLGSSGLSSEAAIVGTMRHDLFERCMQERDFSLDFVANSADNIVRSHAETLVGCELYNDAQARDSILRIFSHIRNFAAKYCAFGPLHSQGTHPGFEARLPGHGSRSDIDFKADAIYATEEAAISPELGLKGFVDATFASTTSPSVDTQPYKNAPKQSIPQPVRSLMGLELKTGHRQQAQNEHLAQLALYTLMLRMRRGSARFDAAHANLNKSSSGQQLTEIEQRHLALANGAASGGVLLYLNAEAYVAVHVAPVLCEIKSLIGQRNLLATEARKAMKPRGIEIFYDDEKRSNGNINILPAPPAQLPEMSTLSSCIRCYSNRECMVHAASDATNAPAIQRSHGQLMNHYTGHLCPADLRYFLDWDRMIDLEAKAGRHDIAKAWLKPSEERERLTGKTFSDLVFSGSFQIGLYKSPKKGCSQNADERGHEKIILRFDRAPDSTKSSPLNSLKVEDRSHVVLSTDGVSLRPSERHVSNKVFRHQMNVFRGIVDKVSDSFVTVLASKNDLLQVQDLISLWQDSCNGNDKGLRFRLDKDDIATGTGTLRRNLVALMSADIATYKPPGKKKDGAPSKSNNAVIELGGVDSRLQRRLPWLRRAIIQMVPPQFDNSRIGVMFDASYFPGAPRINGCHFEQLSTEYSNLNVDQKHAVGKVIAAKDYAIIQGLPGTGKSSTIAFAARLLAAQGKRVLITSYTHAAVDNLLIKLMESGVHGNEYHPNASDLLRIGSKSSCHPDIHPIIADRIALSRESNTSCDKPSASALYQTVSNARIIGCTALTVPRTPLLAKQHFDVVILDEAGQISQPAILGVLVAADSFVLVGDHMQLPPLVADDAAEAAGYGVSMLMRLAEQHPSSIAKLTLQYRMHENICNLCNEIVIDYKGELKCANDWVRNSKLSLSRFPQAIPTPIQQEAFHSSTSASSSSGTTTQKGWLERVINPDQPVVFIDTDALGTSSNGIFQGLERSPGGRKGGTIVNDTEVTLVRSVVRCLLRCGLSSTEIGVICPYRSQLRLLDDDNYLRRTKKAGLEMSTIDRYQGRDKAIIVLSLVRSNAEGKSGRLLEDFRRLNVAVSRAKRKLIIIGSMGTLTRGSEVLRPVLVSMQKRGWVQTLPINAIELYELSSPSLTQASSGSN